MSPFREILEEEFDRLENVLEQRLPQSSRVFNILKIKRLNCLPSKLQTKFFGFTQNGFSDMFVLSMQYFENFEGGFYIVVSAFEQSSVTPALLDGLESLLDWNQTLRIDLPENQRLIDFFKRMEQKNSTGPVKPVLSIHESYGFMMNRNETNILPIDTEPIGIRTGALEVKRLESELDITEVDSYWIRESKLRETVAVSVSSLPSTGVYHKGNLVSFTLTAFHGCVNALFTHDDYRGQGLGQYVTWVTAQGQLKLGLIPSARSLRHNVTAHRVLERAGLAKTHKTAWIDYVVPQP